ncbi:EF-hand domain-containing protein [Ideonella azotifigens]|uniref:EF-hand domain-containing protein n=1 Tax=Ideonella azotifigens TaxID=513160 RepID=A0ABN1KB45_9BURK|nr:EF-hand domain-containing protein [Ideonella azotifigens]MCD2344091.1 EF-hand domain-containing protein [Ideonella azotifigens]
MKIHFVLAAAALLAATGAQAQATAPSADSMKQQIQDRFTKADADHDGKLSRAEAQAGMPRVAAKFDEIDAAHSGFVTLEQILKFAAAAQKK